MGGPKGGVLATRSVEGASGQSGKRVRRVPFRLPKNRARPPPGVREPAFVWGLPLTGNKWRGQMEIVGQPESSKLKEQMHLPLRTVTPDYFDALGIKIVDG